MANDGDCPTCGDKAVMMAYRPYCSQNCQAAAAVVLCDKVAMNGSLCTQPKGHPLNPDGTGHGPFGRWPEENSRDLGGASS